MNSTAILFLLLLSLFGNGPLVPAWSPDHQILATTKVSERFVTPEGPNYTLLLNGCVVYPKPKKARWFSAYKNQHTFLTELHWSPDNQSVAFFEKVYDWEYSDPYNRDFEGSVSNKRYYVAIVSRTGKAVGYPVVRAPKNPHIDWRSPARLAFSGRIFDLQTDPPESID